MKTSISPSLAFLFLSSNIEARHNNEHVAFVQTQAYRTRQFFSRMQLESAVSPMYYQSSQAGEISFSTSREVTKPRKHDIGDMIECAESYGECSIEDIESMAKELELINDECFFELHELEEEHCNEEAAEGREILKRTLDLQHELSLLGKKMEESKHLDSMKKKDWQDEEDHWFGHYVNLYQW